MFFTHLVCHNTSWRATATRAPGVAAVRGANLNFGFPHRSLANQRTVLLHQTYASMVISLLVNINAVVCSAEPLNNP